MLAILKRLFFFADINWISCWERFFVFFVFLFSVFFFHSIQRFIILIMKWITFQRCISEQDKALAPQLHCFAQEFREDVSLHSLLNLKRHPLYFFLFHMILFPYFFILQNSHWQRVWLDPWKVVWSAKFEIHVRKLSCPHCQYGSRFFIIFLLPLLSFHVI